MPPSSPPSKSENASFSVAALEDQRCRGGGAAFAFSAEGDGRYEGNPFAGGGIRPGLFCGVAPMEENSWPSAMNRSAGDAPGMACDLSLIHI